MTTRPSLLRATIMLTAVGLISQALSFLYRIAMARLAGAQVLGLYQLIMPAYAVMQSLCISGLTVAVSVLTAEHHARRDETGLQQVLRTALRALGILWLPILLTVLIFSPALADTLLGDERTELGLVLLLPVLLLTGIENLQKQHFYGVGAMRLPAGVELGEQLVRCLSIIALLVLISPHRSESAVGLIVVGMLVSEIFSSTILTIARILRGRKERPWGGQRIEGAKLRQQMVRIALPVSLTALVGNLMGAATSALIPKLLALHGLQPQQAMEEFGVMLGMTLPLLCIPNAFINALTLALLPRLSEERELGKHSAFRRTGEKAMLSVSYVVLPMIALIATLGPDLGTLLFGDHRVGQHILPLAIGVGASAYHAILVCMLNALGQQSKAAAISLFSGALELLLTVALTGRLGLAGFVIAFVGTELLTTLLCLVAVWRQTGIQINCYRCFTAPILAAILAGALVNLGYRWALAHGMMRYWAVPAGLCFGLAIYLIAMLAQGIRPLGCIRGR